MTAKTTIEKLSSKPKRRKCFICSSVVSYEPRVKTNKRKKEIPCNLNDGSLYTVRLGAAQKN